MDHESQVQNKRMEDMKNLVMTSGWKEVRRIFEDKILGLQHINSIEGETATAMEKSIKVNKKVCEKLYEVLAEVEGTAIAYDLNKPLPTPAYMHRE